jgi:hypothetical protein
MATIVIVPPPRSRGVYLDNRIWARQYVAADTATRSIVELTANTPRAVISATRTALDRAGPSDRIVYATGHGGAGHAPEAGQADLAPARAFRITQFLAYDDDLTGTWPGRPVVEIERDREAALRQRGRARRRLRGEWCDRYVEEHCDLAWTQVGELATLRPFYRELCALFRADPVASVVMLTCNVANAPDFLDELSTDLGVPVVAYTERVMSRWEESGGTRRVWMYLEGDAEGSGTNTDSALTELLPGVSSHQRLTGRVRPAPPPREAVVPEVGDEDE